MPKYSVPHDSDPSSEAFRRDCFVSVVCPIRNQESQILGFIDEVLPILQRAYEYYELVLIDDGSEDDTVSVIAQHLGDRPSIRLIRLSRQFGEELAIYAGLDSAIGDVVVTMMPDHDPPALIPEFVNAVLDHGGMAIGLTRRRKGSLAEKLGARLFYWISNHFLSLHLPENSTHFRAFSRNALNALLQIKDKYRYLKVFSTYIGYHPKLITYDSLPGHKRKTRGLLRSTDLAVNVMVAHSTRLLRLVTGIGVLASGLNLLYMVYIVAIAVFKEDVAEGWITLSAQNAGMFFFLFLILTVLGEYVGRILAESQDRPLYYVMEEKTSAALVPNPDQKNVVTESASNG